MVEWVQEDPTVCEVGDTGGDTQVSDAYGARFHGSEQIDGAWPVIEIAFFASDRWGRNGAALEEWEEAPKDIPPAERFTVTQQLEYCRSRQLEQPWDHAQWETQTYRDAWFHSSVPLTNEQIKSIAERFSADWIHWDGAPMNDWPEWVQGAEPVEEETWEEKILPPDLWKNVIQQQFYLYLRDENDETGAQYLARTFESEYCDTCSLDRDAHQLVLDHKDEWTTSCNIEFDPAFALKVARENAEKGSSERGLRRNRFESAIYALADAEVLSVPAEEALWYRSKANRDAETSEQAWDKSDGARWLADVFTETAKNIERKAES